MQTACSQATATNVVAEIVKRLRSEGGIYTGFLTLAIIHDTLRSVNTP